MTARPVTVQEAAAFLAQRYDDVDPADVAELSGGEWSRAFSFTHGGRELVARFGRWPEDFELDRAAAAFDSEDLPVPEVLEIGNALDGAYAISDRRHGAFLEQLDASAFLGALPALLRALAAMRAIGRDGPPAKPWADVLRSVLVDVPGGRVSGWTARLQQEPELWQLFERANAAFEAVIGDCPDGASLMHLDLINRNVLVADDSRLSAVFDWGCSLYGDPLYEAANLTFWMPWHPNSVGAVDLVGALREHYDVDDFDRRLRCYELHVGLTHMAYCASAPSREEHLHAVARHTQDVLGAIDRR